MNNNPLISFCLLAYNQERYIEDALIAALNQTYSPLEIIISDDCSTDGTVGVIENCLKNYNGPHQIKLNVNQVNIGLTSNFNDVIFNHSSGEYIIIAAGDDISYPERCQISYDFMLNHGECYIADFDVNYINKNGELLDNKLILNNSSFDINDLINDIKLNYRGCSRIYRRKLFDIFGPLSSKCPTEDTPSVIRGLLLGTTWFVRDKVLDYRIHSESISSPKNIVTLNLKEIFDQYRLDLNIALKENVIDISQYEILNRQFSKMYSLRKRQNQIKRMKNYIKDFKNKFWNGIQFLIIK